MINLAKVEIESICSFSRRNSSEIAIVSLATLFLTTSSYHPIEPKWLSSVLYFALLPILTIVVVLRKNPLDFGLRPGNWRIWSFHVLVTILVGAPILFAASRSPSIVAYYASEQRDLARYTLETLGTLFAWEFIFRGFLLFGLRGTLKESSILLQMVPFALLHFGKPEMETLSTILTGIYFGYVAYRGNSYWPAFIMHVFINISLVVFLEFS